MASLLFNLVVELNSLYRRFLSGSVAFDQLIVRGVGAPLRNFVVLYRPEGSNVVMYIDDPRRAA